MKNTTEESLKKALQRAVQRPEMVGVDPGFKDGASRTTFRTNEDGTITAVSDGDETTVDPQTEEIVEDAPPSGPRRKAPAYYAGEFIGVGRHTIRINHPDAERWPNGALVGTKHDKPARRRIRARLKERYSSVEANIKKARQLRLEVDDNATNGHESRRLFDKTLALHVPLPDVDSRALRTEFRARKRALAKERGCHVRDLEHDVVTQLANKVYGVE